MSELLTAEEICNICDPALGCKTRVAPECCFQYLTFKAIVAKCEKAIEQRIAEAVAHTEEVKDDYYKRIAIPIQIKDAVSSAKAEWIKEVKQRCFSHGSADFDQWLEQFKEGEL